MEIRANAVLPARRADVELHAADGPRLTGRLALPEGRTPAATLICLMTPPGAADARLPREAANRLPELADVAVLRLTTRDTRSVEDGAARHDVAAAIAYADSAGLPAPWLLGWSQGAEPALRWGCEPAVAGAIMVSPPRPGEACLAAWTESRKPVLVLVPELAEELSPDAARHAFAALPQAEVVGVAGAGPAWDGEPYVRIALNEIVRRVAPARCPLPLEHPEAGHPSG